MAKLTMDEKLFLKAVELMGDKSYRVDEAEARKDKKTLNHGYLMESTPNGYDYYIYDPEYISKNIDKLNVLININVMSDIQNIKGWVVFFGVISILSLIIGFFL